MAEKKSVVKKAKKPVEEKAVEATETVTLQKLRIKLKAYDHKIIDSSAKQIIDIANRLRTLENAKIQKYIPTIR